MPLSILVWDRPKRAAARPDRPGGAGLAVGLVMLAAIALAGVWADELAPRDPARQYLDQRLAPPGGEFVLGADALGRCVLSQLLHGIRPTLGLAVGTTAAVTLLGLAVGLGCVALPRADGALMRLTDCFFAFPPIVLMLVTVNVLGPGLWSIALALVLSGWPKYARVARTVALTVKAQPFVEATRALGAGGWYVLRRCYLPAVLAPLSTIATIGVGTRIVYIAGLGVLGLGVPPPTPEWGTMLCKGLPLLTTAPHVALAAGAAIVVTTFAFTLAGEALRDRLDPGAAGQLEILWRS